jgi:lipopolysaccharide export system ATP-binding protein
VTAALEARGLAVRLAGADIVRGVDVRVEAGEVVGLLGPSGAGKSTVFRAIAGEVLPGAGTVSVGGVDVSREPLWRRARRGLGYLPQGPSVLVDLSVRENFVAFARLARHAAARDGSTPADATGWAERVDLAHRLDVRAGDLSGGERRRLELGRALVARPRVLVCDEPFAGIDPAGAERLGDLLRDEAARGTAILLADHHVDEALRVVDRALLLLDGAVRVEGTPAEFREHPLVRGRYLGTWRSTHPPAPG